MSGRYDAKNRDEGGGMAGGAGAGGPSAVAVRGGLVGRRFRLGYRLIAVVAAIGFLAFLTVTHYVPLTLGWQPLFAFVGIGLGLVQFARLFLLKRRGLIREATPPVRTIAREIVVSPLILLFAVTTAAGFVQALRDDVSKACTASVTSCYEMDGWKMQSGVYYHRLRHDQPWVAISQATYVAELGSRLRASVSFGLGFLSFGILMSAMEVALIKAGPPPDPLSWSTRRHTV
jgi:hypothetical protein